jgi:hypothetical protein
LHAAAHWEQEEACKLLAENGASFDIKTYSVLDILLTINNYYINLTINLIKKRDKHHLKYVIMIWLQN